ncbi:MAG TPA: anhydro-N-acetylmuramic acid kinase [Flavobacteriales bacterium]|nr:anhydro-N-acetylmuramic acid kinase [Flavobacteriales bacterium]
MSKTYNIIGIMSGTSLDGVDLLWAEFRVNNEDIKYSIKKTRTVHYDKCWLNKLQLAPSLNPMDFLNLHNEYGRYLGNLVNNFIGKDEKQKIDFIASHGHTIFHQPEKKLTFQLGNGNSIAAQTCISTIWDFRAMDVALGGQGAPLVPIGDHLLFGDYDYCLNLGGFSNISYANENNRRIAFDICPVNIALNYFAQQINLPYDKNGRIAKTGRVNNELLNKLNQLPFYQWQPPKSLGREWFEKEFLPVVENLNLPLEDILATITEHIAQQIGKLLSKKDTKTLVTGGGAFNAYLIEKIKNYSGSKIIIPEKEIIEYKEALIFALLGVLFIAKQNNCLQSVTGAGRDNIGGCLSYGNIEK